jgi:hypothetical protein
MTKVRASGIEPGRRGYGSLQVRSTLADQIERGEPLQPVRLCDPAQQQRNSREAERAVARS